ncbi:MAG: ammonium transporter [Oxalobacter sp.]|nr:ammonium transporter [Oxalobacter sp.]
MRRGLTGLIAILGFAISTSAFAEEAAPTLDSGDTAWILTSTLLVLLMTAPGIGLFYGGLVRAKNMLSVLMQTFMAFSLVTILWFLYGYSFAFTGDGPIIGTAEKLFMRGITIDTLSSVLPTVPEYAWAAFQGSFACITATLLIGGFAERIKFGAVMAFIAVWFTLSYVPQAHMVWGGGFLQEDGALDFAGGTVVHINAAVAGLIGAYFVGRRKGFGRNTMMPHSLTLTMVGASLLWIGWFGFNAGSAGAANGLAALAFVNTVCAAGAAALSWAIAETFTRGKAGMLGAASGAVAGLVVITPAAGFVGPMGAIVMGLIAGVVCLWGVTGLKRLLRVDDALDSFGVHGVGGIVGAILTGIFVNTCLGGQGSDFSMAQQVWIQFKSVIISLVWSGVVSLVTYFVIDKVWGLRVTEEEEEEGLDKTSHGESAYHY